MKVCFFARVPDPRMLDDMTFYSEDLRILSELGHTVVRATRFGEIASDCDLYFTWWYAWGFLPLSKSIPAGKPHIMVGPVHYGDTEFGFFKRPFLRQCSIRFSLRLADAAIAPSEIEYQGIKMLGARRPWMVFHSVDAPAEVQPLERRAHEILSIGHLDWFGIARKRFYNVVRAIPMVVGRFPEVRFVIIGRKGTGFDKLHDLVKELGVERFIEFPGAVNQQTKSEYLQRSMILAQPALYEGFGVAQLEAMAHGLPVVTSAGGAVSEVVANCGLYCDKDSPANIAGQIIRLLEDRQLWQKLSNAGRDRARENFSRSTRKEKIARIIDSVTKAR